MVCIMKQSLAFLRSAYIGKEYFTRKYTNTTRTIYLQLPRLVVYLQEKFKKYSFLFFSYFFFSFAIISEPPFKLI